MLISSMATQRRMQSGPGSRATISPVMAGGRPTSGQAGPGTRIMVPLRGGASGASRSGGYPVSYMQASTAVGQCSTAFSPYSQPSTSYPGQTRMASQMYGTSRTGGVLSHVAVAGSSQSYARSSPRIPSSSPRGAGRSVADAATAATATHGATAVKMITGGGGASSSVANRGRSRALLRTGHCQLARHHEVLEDVPVQRRRQELPRPAVLVPVQPDQAPLRREGVAAHATLG